MKIPSCATLFSILLSCSIYADQDRLALMKAASERMAVVAHLHKAHNRLITNPLINQNFVQQIPCDIAQLLCPKLDNVKKEVSKSLSILSNSHTTFAHVKDVVNKVQNISEHLNSEMQVLEQHPLVTHYKCSARLQALASKMSTTIFSANYKEPSYLHERFFGIPESFSRCFFAASCKMWLGSLLHYYSFPPLISKYFLYKGVIDALRLPLFMIHHYNVNQVVNEFEKLQLSLLVRNDSTDHVTPNTIVKNPNAHGESNDHFLFDNFDENTRQEQRWTQALSNACVISEKKYAWYDSCIALLSDRRSFLLYMITSPSFLLHAGRVTCAKLFKTL